MKRNHALVGLLVVTAAAAVWLATAFLGGEGPGALQGDLGPGGIPAATPAPELEIAAPLSSESAPAARAAVEAAPVALEAAPDSWAGELGGLVGRVVEEDETPVAGVSVALVQVDASLLLAADWARMGEAPPKLVIADTVTDEAGRFRLDGGYDASFQGLGIDLRGPRSTVRVVDTQLHHGEVTDVGDIVLPAGCTVIGRVVDEAGSPVPGARVRIVSAPPVDVEQFLQVGVQDFRADCAVGISKMIVEAEGSPVIEPPPLVRRHIDDLPIPTTYTNPDGEYRFEGAPIGKLIQGVDLRGLLGVCRVVTTTPGEVELEEARLLPGRTVQGTVIDDNGDPVEGAEVMAGSELFFGEAGILQPAGRSDRDGRFSVSGCPDTGDVMACARRSPDEPWVGVLGGDGEQLEIELESTVALTVRVVDFTGAAVRGARVELAPAFGADSPMGMLGAFMSLGAEPLDARFEETEPGTYVCAEVTPGKYDVTARPAELASTHKQVELWGGKADVTLICDRGQSLDVAVLDAKTREGIRGARATIVGARPPLMRALAVGRTGEDGLVALGPYSTRKSSEDENAFGGMGDWLGGLQVLAQHPRYADGSAKLVEGAERLEVLLQRGGTLHGQITWGPDPPRKIYTLVIEHRGDNEGLMEAFLPPRLSRSGLTGEFRFTNLTPGIYRVAVFERFLDGDPIAFMMAQQEPVMVHREEDVLVAPGERTEVSIDLSPSGRGQTARITGSISIDGRPAEGATVRVSGRGPGVDTETDAYGNYETPDFLALSEVRVRVTGDVRTATGTTQNLNLYNESLTVEPLTVHRLDLDLHSQSLRVRVVAQASGAPVAGARVSVRAKRGFGRNANTKTDAAGEAEIAIVGEGEQIVTVSADGFAEGTARFDPQAGDFDGELRVELKSPVPCAGICDLSAFDGSSLNMVFLRVDDDWERLDQADLQDDRRAAFRLEGLSPGPHEASVWVDREQSETVKFDLPEQGDENLVLEFTKASEGR